MKTESEWNKLIEGKNSEKFQSDHEERIWLVKPELNVCKKTERTKMSLMINIEDIQKKEKKKSAPAIHCYTWNWWMENMRIWKTMRNPTSVTYFVPDDAYDKL